MWRHTAWLLAEKELLYEKALDLAIGTKIALNISRTVAQQPQAFTTVVPMC